MPNGFFLKIKDLLREHHRLAFALGLALTVGLALAASSLFGGGREAAPHRPEAAARQEAPAQKQEASEAKSQEQIRPVVAGPVEVKSITAFVNPTLGGVLPPGEGVLVDAGGDPWRWNAASPGSGEAAPKAATVTWPLGGRFRSGTLKVGFCPSAEGDESGGVYELYLDGRRVWRKELTPEAVAMGRAADEALRLDLRGVNALTLRVAALARPAEFGGRETTCPYSVALYEIKLEKEADAR